MSDNFTHVLNIRELLLKYGENKEELKQITHFIKAEEVPKDVIEQVQKQGFRFVESLKYDGQSRIYVLKSENLDSLTVELLSRRAALGTSKEKKEEAQLFEKFIGEKNMREIFLIIQDQFGKIDAVKVVAEYYPEGKEKRIYSINILFEREGASFWVDQLLSFDIFQKLNIKHVEYSKETYDFNQVMERFLKIDEIKDIEGKVYSQCLEKEKYLNDHDVLVFKLKTQEYLKKEAQGNQQTINKKDEKPKQPKKLNPSDFVNPQLFQKAKDQFGDNGKVEDMIEYMVTEVWQQFDENGGVKAEWDTKIDLKKIVSAKYQAFLKK